MTLLLLTERLCRAEDKADLLPIHYCYDWIGGLAPYVQRASLKLNSLIQNSQTDGNPSRGGSSLCRKSDTPRLNHEHSIVLDPVAAKLPWTTSIDPVRQSKYWKAAEEGYVRILTQFANDETAKRTPRPDTFTVADMARKELSRLESGCVRFATYMCPFADEHKVRLLAEMQSLSLIFDESWEIHEHDHNEAFLRSLMPPENHKDLTPKTPLQQAIWDAIEQVLERDRKDNATGGQELIDFLTSYISHPTPTKEFQTFGDFMEHRRNDAGMIICWTSAKFSIGSRVEFYGPKLGNLTRLLGYQMLAMNDIASYDKEKMYWQRGQAKQFETTNGVVILRNLLALPSDEAAKAMAYANQMESERSIDLELQQLMRSGSLTDEDWMLIESMIYSVTGNMMAAITMSRYGGERARLRKKDVVEHSRKGNV
ncbi:terpenoid synthase [Aspergillus campestris IBT 28561]|uniref:Terpenoid synthase n=1 Tax=Aspergillus campestris (strain IBT 28561) TaxID=1392248 RepID=A0A2I1CXS7_ASPC2|nr:terpenoid synthase [Aspergillus campestris IBT 28561]PKY02424.1 terpenoid synthase [Aspergillus campestris IBT 28561]